ncbi:hypothetical protein V6N13_025414 [Hibiscus sabdariffa]|uniref:VQ domain-containing protein n=1 Tax=Hibiscus sabdariffa TaxID=183260 RepID=A0ABR2P8S0_9ROSI
MNSSDLPGIGSLRKELQGPRPAPLKVRKDSHKIRKPQSAPQQQQQPSQIRPPVIIYIASPKVIHTNPSDFMDLVQRLTGSTSLSDQTNAAISPAARFASIEMTKSPHGGKRSATDAEFYVKGCQLLDNYIRTENVEVVQGTEIEMNPGVERANLFPGILSPGPTSLPPISPSFFSPPRSDQDSISFFHDLSPGSFMPSPSSFHIPPSYLLPSAIAPSIDLFNNFFNL